MTSVTVKRGGIGRTVRSVAVGLGFMVVVVLSLLWLAGVFAPKVAAELAAASSPVGRPIPPGAQLVPVELRRVPQVETAVGTIRAVHETAVASKLLAKVLAVNVQAGQSVQEGDVLIRLDDADLQAQLRQAAAGIEAAQAALANAQFEYDRVKPLYEQGIESRAAFDRVDTTLKMSQASLEQARQLHARAATQLDYATIRSPLTGRVVDKRIEVGDTAQPGQPLVTLYNPDRMQLVASVRESLTQRLATGQTIGVQIDSLGKACTGQISEIVPEAESASRSFLVKVTGPCPPGIYSGMFGRLLIPLDEEDVVVIPRAAVRQVGQLHMVDVAETSATGSVLQRRIVQLGRELDEQVQVLSGLRPGEMVALRPAGA